MGMVREPCKGLHRFAVREQPEEKMMAEQLLTAKQAATRLGVCYRTFNEYRPRLVAKGLQEVFVGKSRKFRQASLDRLIQKAAAEGTAL